MGVDRSVEKRFHLLFERNWRPVRTYALRRSQDPSAADDVVADVFMTAWRRIDDVPAGNELAWLLGVARKVLSNTRRGQVRRARLLERLRQTEVDFEVNEAEFADEPESAQRVRAALDRMPELDAEALRLSVWERLTHAQIAHVLECSENAVAVRLHRARRRLAQMMTEESLASDEPTGGGGNPEAVP